MSVEFGAVLSADNIKALDDLKNNLKDVQLKKNQELGKDAFLKLMMVQLAHQDPLSPLDNKEMITQMAQFSSVEQLGSIDSSLEAGNIKSDNILTVLLEMNKTSSGVKTDEKMDDLINKTDLSNELNTKILDELIALNAAMNAYDK